MWIGEAPGTEEDASGIPFDGTSGELLHKILAALGTSARKVWLTNVVNCRLDEARKLTQQQVRSCRNHLLEQIEVVDPQVIVPLGSVAWRWFQRSDKRKIGEVRGKVYRWYRRLLVPTYHPAYLLRRPDHKGLVWKDVQVAAELTKHPERAADHKPVDITLAYRAEQQLQSPALF